MRILISARGFDDRKKHEIGIFELDQAKALRDAGHEVRIAAIDTRSVRHRRTWGLCEYMQDGIRVCGCALPAGPLPFGLGEKAQRLAASAIWGRITRDGWRPEIIHAHFGAGFLPTAKKEKIPFVYTEHFSGANKAEITDKELQREKSVYPRADRLICVSHALAGHVREHTGAEAGVIPNIIDLNVFAPAKREHTGFRFASVCNLVPVKNIASLLNAFAALRGDDLRLTVVGDGPLLSSLRAQAEALGIGERVAFTGRLSREEINALFAETDCFVLPSRSETFGAAYAEAMAAGLPVIATRCGGPEDFVNERNGLLVPVDDTKALAEAMETMMRERGEYNSAAIAAEIREKYSPATVAEQLTAVYRSLI